MATPAVSDVAPQRREQTGWYIYDWANSAFYTTVVTVFLGPYLTTLARAAANGGEHVYPFGVQVAVGSFFPYMVSLSVFLQIFFLPILGAIADYSNRKKQMLGFFAYLGSLATMAMFVLDGTDYVLGGALFLLANLSFGASIVFYNAFLPEIAGPAERDAVSSKGWALGYLGGGILLAVNLLFFSRAESFGLTSSQAVRISLGLAGLWWAGFSIPALLLLRSRESVKQLPPGEHFITVGFKQFAHTLKSARQYPQTMLFLLAYLFYNDGIQTVISLSAQFGQEELGLGMQTLTTAVLIVQFVAFGGALLFGRLAKSMGAKRAVMLSLFIWTLTLAYIYGFVYSEQQFYIMAAIVAVVLGGSQALSRSIYSQMIPKGQESEYFSLYEISDRGTSWLGPMFFGLGLQLTGSYRVAIVSLVLFFAIGLAVLSRVDVEAAAREARRE